MAKSYFSNIKCEDCGTIFSGHYCRLPKTCSKKCRTELQRRNAGRPVGIPHTEQWRKQMSALWKERGNPFKGKNHSPEARVKVSASLIGKTGELSRNWKGGKCSGHKLFRNKKQWSTWREAVYSRDGYRCIDCGERQNLEPHHIYPIRLYPERAYDVRNGITLCRTCHQKTFRRELELSQTYFSLIPNY